MRYGFHFSLPKCKIWWPTAPQTFLTNMYPNKIYLQKCHTRVTSAYCIGSFSGRILPVACTVGFCVYWPRCRTGRPTRDSHSFEKLCNCLRNKSSPSGDSIEAMRERCYMLRQSYRKLSESVACKSLPRSLVSAFFCTKPIAQCQPRSWPLQLCPSPFRQLSCNTPEYQVSMTT